MVPPIVNPKNREENSHIGARRREWGHLSNQEEGFAERIVRREPILENPPQTKVEKKMTNMITKLEQRCDLLSEVVNWLDKGKASLVDNLLQKTTSPFTDEVATFILPEKFKVPDVPIYTEQEDQIEHLIFFFYLF
jgi:hypothetical protein